MRIVLACFACAVLWVVSVPAFAQENSAEIEAFDRRLELAKKMQSLRPAREQINNAIDHYIANFPPNRKERYRAALQNILNYRALEKISVDAYAEVYSEEELRAMVDYYAKPEARSASEKSDQYADIVLPEIVRMLDKAMMRLKTGGGTP